MTIQRVGVNCMNNTYLKLIALTTMIIDHVGAIFFSFEPNFRIIGRIAFPIYCFLLVEGYFHTRDVKKYSIRLFLFALVSELPFDYAFFGGMNNTHQNIFFTLFLGLLAVHAIEEYFMKKPVISVPVLFLAFFLSEYFHTDYGMLGILYILTFYGLRKVDGLPKVLLMVVFIGILNILLSRGVQYYSVLAVPFIAAYNGKPGPRNILLKYGFYTAYPLHLLILYLLQ